MITSWQPLNPDDPSLDVYKEYINCSRPLPEWEADTPQEIKDELKEEPKPGWVHWFFSFDDNAGLPEEKKKQIIQNTPKGTKIYKNKIEGLRGKATGLVFSIFLRQQHVRTKEWAKQFVQRLGEPKKHEIFMWFSAAVDTSYSQKSPDTIAFSYLGITNKGKCIVLDEKVYSNAELDIPLAPSDTVKNLIDFLDRNKKEWGLARRRYSWTVPIRQPCRNGISISEEMAAFIHLTMHGKKWRLSIVSMPSLDGWHLMTRRALSRVFLYLIPARLTFMRWKHTAGEKIKTIHQKMGMTIWLTLCSMHGSHTRARFTRGDDYELASEFYCTAIPDRTCKRQGDYNQRSSYLP